MRRDCPTRRVGDSRRDVPRWFARGSMVCETCSMAAKRLIRFSGASVCTRRHDAPFLMMRYTVQVVFFGFFLSEHRRFCAQEERVGPSRSSESGIWRMTDRSCQKFTIRASLHGLVWLCLPCSKLLGGSLTYLPKVGRLSRGACRPHS